MGNSSSYTHSSRTQSSKKHGDLPGNDVPTLEEEERRPNYVGRSACPAMERQCRHSRHDHWTKRKH